MFDIYYRAWLNDEIKNLLSDGYSIRTIPVVLEPGRGGGVDARNALEKRSCMLIHEAKTDSRIDSVEVGFLRTQTKRDKASNEENVRESGIGKAKERPKKKEACFVYTSLTKRAPEPVTHSNVPLGTVYCKSLKKYSRNCKVFV